MNLEFLKPYLSIAIVLSCLFTVVYIKMENRLMGYALFDLEKKEKSKFSVSSDIDVLAVHLNEKSEKYGY